MSASNSAANRRNALLSWGRTPDRTARTAAARSSGPGSLAYWLARLDPERFDDATDAQRAAAAEALRKAHYAGLAALSAAKRKRSAA